MKLQLWIVTRDDNHCSAECAYYTPTKAVGHESRAAGKPAECLLGVKPEKLKGLVRTKLCHALESKAEMQLNKHFAKIAKHQRDRERKAKKEHKPKKRELRAG